MSKLPSIKRLAVEDFAGQKDWIGKLFYPVNQFFEAVTAALNNGLTFTENLSATVKQIEAPGTYPLYFAWRLKSKPIGLWVIQAHEKAGVHANFASAISADWEFTSDNQVKINGFPGLPTNVTYIVTVIAITG